jgi:hypothetical protein
MWEPPSSVRPSVCKLVKQTKPSCRIIMKNRLGVPHANLSSSSSFVQMDPATVPLCSGTQKNPTLIARRGRSSVLIMCSCQLCESGFGDGRPAGRTFMVVNETTFTYVLRDGASFRKQTAPLLASASAPHIARFAVLLNITHTNGKS